jgi:hypothetical protein
MQAPATSFLSPIGNLSPPVTVLACTTPPTLWLIQLAPSPYACSTRFRSFCLLTFLRLQDIRLGAADIAKTQIQVREPPTLVRWHHSFPRRFILTLYPPCIIMYPARLFFSSQLLPNSPLLLAQLVLSASLALSQPLTRRAVTLLA